MSTQSPLKFLPTALSMYKGGAGWATHVVINQYLRGRKFNQQLEEKAEAISTCLLPLEGELQVFRGTGMQEFHRTTVQIGQSYICRGFTSTSVDEKKALLFATGKNKGYFLKLKLPIGLKVFYINRSYSVGRGSNEDEVLVDKNTRFTITGVNTEANRSYVVVEATAEPITLPRKTRF